jgi:hypothetical protein
LIVRNADASVAEAVCACIVPEVTESVELCIWKQPTTIAFFVTVVTVSLGVRVALSLALAVPMPVTLINVPPANARGEEPFIDTTVAAYAADVQAHI